MSPPLPNDPPVKPASHAIRIIFEMRASTSIISLARGDSWISIQSSNKKTNNSYNLRVSTEFRRASIGISIHSIREFRIIHQIQSTIRIIFGWVQNFVERQSVLPQFVLCTTICYHDSWCIPPLSFWVVFIDSCIVFMAFRVWQQGLQDFRSRWALSDDVNLY